MKDELVERLRGADGKFFMQLPAYAEDLRKEAADRIESLEAKLEKAREGLEQIASLDDLRAGEYLEQAGSYAMFDEPGSVEIARQALKEISQ